MMQVIITIVMLLATSAYTKPSFHPPLKQIEEAFASWHHQQQLFQQPACPLYPSIETFISRISTSLISSSGSSPDTLKTLLNDYQTLLLQHTNNNAEQAFHLANQLFEHFIKNNPHEFITAHSDNKTKPLLHFFYAVLWLQLCQKGWKSWSSQCLNALAEAQHDKNIVYIAGGFDFFYLLKQDLHNITIIDPFLPSQQRYYPEHYNYLLQGNPLDVFHITTTCFLERIKSVTNGWFSLQNGATFPQLTSVWNIITDGQNKGQLTFLRSIITNQHLAEYKNALFLISFNELFYFVTPPYLGGWNIDIAALPEDFLLFVKQLYKPLTKQDLITLRISYILNALELRFLALGNDVT